MVVNWNQLESVIDYLNSADLISGSVNAELFSKLLSKHKDLKKLTPVLFSPYVFSSLRKYPWILEQELGYDDIFSDIGTIKELDGDSIDDFKAKIRRKRNSIYSRIAINLLSKNFSYAEIIKLLSLAAENFISIAFNYSAGDIAERLVLFAMGKLGGRELNFSSDVDLILICDTDELKLRAEKVARAMDDILSDFTEDGFVLRVDYELRPGGKNAGLVPSLDEAYSYYEGWSNTWERLAWLKGRAICGSSDLGKKFLDSIRPMVFRKYLDYSTIDEVRTIKRLMRYEAFSKRDEYNLKLGRGGIRELEFSIASLFLIYSGRFSSLQEYALNYITMLEKLKEFKILSRDEADKMVTNYISLRDIEHYLQSFNDRQTHTIGRKELNRLLFVRYGEEFILNQDRCLKDFEETVEWNYSFFKGLFSDEKTPEEESQEAFILLGKDNPERLDILKKVGFNDPSTAVNNLDEIFEILNFKYFSTNIRERAFEVLQIFIRKTCKLSKPDQVLLRLKRFLNAVKSRPTLFLLLYEKKELIDIFMNLFESGAYFSEMFIHHPEFIDAMIMGGEMVTSKGRKGMMQSFEQFYQDCCDIEQGIESLKLFKVYEELRIGSSFLSEFITFFDASTELSILADIVVKEIFNMVCKGEDGIAVIGLGRLGEKTLNFGSDLDLVFLYDENSHNIDEVTKKSQRIVTLLSSQSRYGNLYEVDMTLRPSGGKGPIAVGIDSFIKYHEENIELWEKVALWKTRFVAGDAKVGEKIIRFKNHHLRKVSVTSKNLNRLKEVRDLFLEEFEIKNKDFNIKYGQGGLIEIEYLTRILQIRNDRISYTGIISALKALIRKGVDSASILYSAFNFYMKLETILRLNRYKHIPDEFDSDIKYWKHEVHNLYLKLTGS